MTFVAELKRRKVFRVAAVYAATGYVVLEAADLILPRLGVPDWAMSLLVGIVLVGFPLALVMAWALELTPGGQVRSQSPATRSDAAPEAAAAAGQPLFGARTLIVTGLLVALGVGLSAGWFLKPEATSAPSLAGPPGEPVTTADAAADPAAARPSVAVLPFDNLSSDPEQGYFADGLTEEVLNALAALPNLLVTARTSSFYYKDKDVPVDEIGARLGVDHVLEGSVRRSGEEMRVTAQLVRARDGFHLWSETYDRPVDDAFRVQTDIATEVASALGILLDDQQRARMEAAGVRDPEAYALYAKGFEVYQLAHGGAPQIPTLVEANGWFDRAFERAPDLWVAAFHSADLYSHMLLVLAAGVDPDALPPEEMARAREEHERRLREASRAAPSQAARDYIEVTRMLFSDDWTGLAALMRRAYEHTEACGYDQWMHVAGPAFGMAEAARELFLRATRCNGLDESNWLHAATASLYAGDAARALELADRGLEVADIEGYGLQGGRLISLLALERYDEASASLSGLSGSLNTSRLLGEAWLAAARGDREALDAVRAQMTSAQPGIANELILAARAGDRADATARAAAIDARPAGPAYLMVAIYYCLCGAPFDLDATPNLAARLEEAGLEWPPTRPMEWPLKEW